MPRALVALMVSVLTSSACHMEGPPIPMSETSPDGRWTAFARNHFTIDGPDQSIWVGETRKPPAKLRQLGADSEWISAIVWSPDSRLVGFLTMDSVLDVYELPSMARVASGHVRSNPGDYPPRYPVREVAFTPDSNGITYLPCERDFTARAGTGRLPDPRTCTGARQTLTIADFAHREARLHPGRAF